MNAVCIRSEGLGALPSYGFCSRAARNMLSIRHIPRSSLTLLTHPPYYSRKGIPHTIIQCTIPALEEYACWKQTGNPARNSMQHRLRAISRALWPGSWVRSPTEALITAVPQAVGSTTGSSDQPSSHRHGQHPSSASAFPSS
jgi:hypothetical protein